MAENQKETVELSFDEEVDAFLNMDPKERERETERLMAERIVYYRRKAREKEAEQNEGN